VINKVILSQIVNLKQTIFQKLNIKN